MDANFRKFSIHFIQLCGIFRKIKDNIKLTVSEQKLYDAVLAAIPAIQRYADNPEMNIEQTSENTDGDVIKEQFNKIIKTYNERKSKKRKKKHEEKSSPEDKEGDKLVAEHVDIWLQEFKDIKKNKWIVIDEPEIDQHPLLADTSGEGVEEEEVGKEVEGEVGKEVEGEGVEGEVGKEVEGKEKGNEEGGKKEGEVKEDINAVKDDLVKRILSFQKG